MDSFSALRVGNDDDDPLVTMRIAQQKILRQCVI